MSNSLIELAVVGSRIARLRKRRGLSQGELADKIGVSLRSVQSYELGHHTEVHLEAIAKELKADPDDLLYGSAREVALETRAEVAALREQMDKMQREFQQLVVIGRLFERLADVETVRLDT